MKKIYLTLVLISSITAFGQQIVNEDSHELFEDTIIKLSKNLDEQPIWNYSSLNFSNYPNTTEIDYNQIQNVQVLSSQYNALQLNDSIVGELPITNLTDEGDAYSISGNFVYKQGKIGDLIVANDTLINMKQVIYTENYFLLHTNDSLGIDTVTFYNNTYYSFINETTNELLFEVFNKKRTLKGMQTWSRNGISKCTLCTNNYEVSDIQLNLSPNPASESTIISFTLPQSSEISISLSNQTNTVNEILYTGLAEEGLNEFELLTQIYPTGSYTLTVNTGVSQYSSTLVIL